MKALLIITSLVASLFSSSALVSPKWLSENLKADRLVIVDVSEKTVYGAEGHIPGAVNTEIGAWRSASGPYLTVRSEKAIETEMRRLGIDNESHVVIYAHIKTPKDFLKASYLYWAMRYHGLKQVSLLDGGFEAWVKESLPITIQTETGKQGNFMAVRNPDLITDRIYVTKQIGKTPMIDARPPEYYFGILPSAGVERSGHITGAMSYFWKYSVDDAYRLKPVGELEAVFGDGLGLKKDQEVIVYCTGGLETSYNFFVLEGVLGYQKVRLYDESMKEWGNREDTPMQRYRWEMFAK